jgi:hypothetical protein
MSGRGIPSLRLRGPALAAARRTVHPRQIAVVKARSGGSKLPCRPLRLRHRRSEGHSISRHGDESPCKALRQVARRKIRLPNLRPSGNCASTSTHCCPRAGTSVAAGRTRDPFLGFPYDARPSNQPRHGQSSTDGGLSATGCRATGTADCQACPWLRCSRKDRLARLGLDSTTIIELSCLPIDRKSDELSQIRGKQEPNCLWNSTNKPRTFPIGCPGARDGHSARAGAHFLCRQPSPVR